MWGYFMNWTHSVGLFALSFVLGIILGWSSGGIMGCWAAMELCSLALMPVLSGTSVSESDGALVYFSLQAFGSFMIFLGCLFLNAGAYPVSVFLSSTLLCVGLFLKLGAFPISFWVPRVMSVMSWFGCFMVSVPQKFLPLLILNEAMVLTGPGGLGKMLGWVEAVACVTAISATVMSVGVKDLRILFSFSSIIQSCFMMMVACSDFSLTLFYLVTYGLICWGFCFSMSWLGVYSASCVSRMGKVEKEMFGFSVGCYALSFAGLPPFLGFGLKAVFIRGCIEMFPVGCTILTLLSVISMYFYYDIFISCVLGTWSGIYSFWVGLRSQYSVESRMSAFMSVFIINSFGGFLFLILASVLHL